MPAAAILHRDEIINRVASGEYLASSAQSLGLAGKGQAISNVLAEDPDYQAARETGLEAKMAARESELELAEPATVPRARELLSHQRWRCEREAPHRWGQKGTVINLQVNVGPAASLDGLADNLLGAVRIIEQLPQKEAGENEGD